MNIDKIEDFEIDAIEQIILNGKRFDFERRDFIKCIDKSIDLVACAGSGKTTSLITKIILLANRMPFADARGICVLTHTNVAINEIKEKLGSRSNNLFRYPNYFGTIQSFVNKFLALPCLCLQRGNKQVIIDESTYYKRISQKEKAFPKIKGFVQQDYKNISYFKLNNENFIYSYRFDLVENEVVILKKMGGKIEEFIAPKKRKTDFTIDEKLKIKEWFQKFKKSIHKEGIFCYDDMYFLSKIYLNSNPQIIGIFGKRFNHIFIDEMQDSTTWQLEILDNLFSNKEDVVLQRIGDPNQEIFDSGSNTAWKPDLNNQDRVKQFNKSLRFGEQIANRIKFFCVSNISETLTGSEVDSFVPHIILFKDETIGKTIEKFCELIHQHDLHLHSRKIFKAIGWRSKVETGKTCINNYYPDFQKRRSFKKVVYPNLLSFLIKQENASDTYNQIINAFIELLSIGEIRIENRRYTKSLFFKIFSTIEETEFNRFLVLVSSCVFDLHCTCSYFDKVWKQLSEYIEHSFCDLFQIDFRKVEEFVRNKDVEIVLNSNVSHNKYCAKNHKGIEVEIDTIHSVKGETHTATLLLETHYEGKVESQYLINQLKGLSYVRKKGRGVYLEKCLKMAYVAMSRPTHLLCFAINIKHIKDYLEEIRLSENNPNGWMIIDDLI